MPAKLLDLRGFARGRVNAEPDQVLASSGEKSVDLAFSGLGYVTIHVTNDYTAMRYTMV